MHGSRAQFSKSYMHGSFLPLTATCLFAFVFTADLLLLLVEICKFVHSNRMTEVKMTVHIGFVNLSTAVTTDADISS